MHDVVVRNGVVQDGLGSPARRADVAIAGDQVVAVGDDVGAGRREIDAEGQIVAPGFIDPHAHSDMVPFMDDPQPFKVLQGVTTEIVGNCGFSFAPLSEESAAHAAVAFGELSASGAVQAGSFGDFLDRVEAAGPTNHIAALVGHNALRLTANGTEQTLQPGGLEKMCALADAAFADGAVGLSTGLIYVPGAYSTTDEIVALATVAHRWDRPYTTHMRDEGPGLGAALDEALEIGRRAGVRVQISHCKAAGRDSHGDSEMLLDKLRQARVAGVDVRGDQYPYLAGASFLSALLPPEVQAGGMDALVERLRDPAERAGLRAVAERAPDATGAGLWRQATPADVLIIRHHDARHRGVTLEAVAGGADPWETLCELVAADPTAMMVVTMMAEDDVRTIMADPLVSVGSDSGIPVGLDHQRTWGCFARFLGTYVRDAGIVDWPEAIRKLTSASARQFGLTGRGWLGPGAVADVCVFDPDHVGHAGTYLEPAVPPTGITNVLLAGTVVVDAGEFTGSRAGRVLRSTEPWR